MIRKLRWKFIAVTMAVVFAMLTLIVSVINAVNIWQSNASLDSVTEMILYNGGTFRKDLNVFGKRDDRFPKDDAGGRFHEKELPFSTRFFTVTLDPSQNILFYDLSSIASVSETEAAELTKAILTKRRDTGWFQTWRYRVGETESGFLLIVTEATSVRRSMFSVLMITLLVGMGTFCAIFALLVPLSKKIIRPISDTYEKQRQFITDASHELKTPLTVIYANAEILGMTGGENEWTDGILRQCRHMRSLVEKMVQMSRLDEEKAMLTLEPFDLSEAIYDTAMSFQGPVNARELSLLTDITPGCVLKGDEGLVRQLVSILMDNALKYCDKGGEIYVTLKRSGKGLRSAFEISVDNTYSGLADLETGKLFERFYRADQSHTDNGSYGLGLPIAKSITEQHGGTITAVKKFPETVSFVVTLRCLL